MSAKLKSISAVPVGNVIVHVDSAEKRARLPAFTEANCPHCNGPVEVGFGLAGGGFGPYTYCPHCHKVTSKTVQPQDDE